MANHEPFVLSYGNSWWTSLTAQYVNWSWHIGHLYFNKVMVAVWSILRTAKCHEKLDVLVNVRQTMSPRNQYYNESCRAWTVFTVSMCWVNTLVSPRPHYCTYDAPPRLCLVNTCQLWANMSISIATWCACILLICSFRAHPPCVNIHD